MSGVRVARSIFKPGGKKVVGNYDGELNCATVRINVNVNNVTINRSSESVQWLLAMPLITVWLIHTTFQSNQSIDACALLWLCANFFWYFSTSRKTGFIYNVESEKHLCKWDPLHAEGPYRTQSIMRRLEEPEGKLNWVDGMIGYWSIVRSIDRLIDWFLVRLIDCSMDLLIIWFFERIRIAVVVLYAVLSGWKHHQ